MVFTFSDWGVFALHFGILEQVLLHVADHILAVHIHVVEIRSLHSAIAKHVGALHHSGRHHALAISGGSLTIRPIKHHLLLLWHVGRIELINIALTVMDRFIVGVAVILLQVLNGLYRDILDLVWGSSISVYLFLA